MEGEEEIHAVKIPASAHRPMTMPMKSSLAPALGIVVVTHGLLKQRPWLTDD